MGTTIFDLIRGGRRDASDRPLNSSLSSLARQASTSGLAARRRSAGVMKKLTAAVIGLVALLGTSLSPAAAQVWAPPPAWGPGWHHWVGHHRWVPGWRGPVWIAAPGPIMVGIAGTADGIGNAGGGGQARLTSSGAATDLEEIGRAHV